MPPAKLIIKIALKPIVKFSGDSSKISRLINWCDLVVTKFYSENAKSTLLQIIKSKLSGTA